MKRGLGFTVPILLAGVCLAKAAAAQTEVASDDESIASLGTDPALGLDPSLPEVGGLPGGMTPAYGQKAEGRQDWRFDFHGFLTAPLRAGLNTRENPEDGQSETVLHAPPVVPDDYDTFSHTGIIPNPYVQLNFSYGNSVVTGTASIVARQATVSTGFFDPPSQAGVNDLFLSIRPDLGKRLRLQMHIGAFTNRYGIMGEYDEGRYGTPLIARLNGAGENVIATFSVSRDVTLLAEQGILGQTNKAPADITPDGWNDFADSNVGAGFVHHEHVGLGYKDLVTLGGHYITAWSQDDRGSGPLGPDGRILILGADLRLSMGRFGHLYGAYSHTDARDARTVGRIVEVLNTRGGPGLMQNYLGEVGRGTGTLSTWGAQYDLSIGKLVSYPVEFSGDGADLFVSLFGMHTSVTSEDPDFDDITKFKYGTEVTYALLSWLSASMRYDRVAPNTDNDRYSFAAISPRLIFHSDWQSTDQVVLGYSHYMNGSLTTVRTGYPPVEDVTMIPDEDVLYLSASMWW